MYHINVFPNLCYFQTVKHHPLERDWIYSCHAVVRVLLVLLSFVDSDDVFFRLLIKIGPQTSTSYNCYFLQQMISALRELNVAIKIVISLYDFQ
jgi:hypothetical protein